MYGETTNSRIEPAPYRGLSPHVRGNPGRLGAVAARRRSIPACTGKPGVGQCDIHGGKVYPRMYGETATVVMLTIVVVGLSPHVRGNRVAVHADRTPPGSIPACTGKPIGHYHIRPDHQVYPRMYGETLHHFQLDRAGGGLSPHVRGNPGRGVEAEYLVGSIPACTGKPSRKR